MGQGAPRVTPSVQNLTSYVPSLGGIAVAIVGAFKKGPVGQWGLVSKDTDFLHQYSPDDTVAVGFDLAYYSALAALTGTNQLYVVRAVNGALGAGLMLTTNGAILLPYSIPIGYADPMYNLYDFGASATVRGNLAVYVAGAKIIPAVANGFYYNCTVAGTSGASPPTYPVTIGATVVDGSVTWTCEGTATGGSIGDVDLCLIFSANGGTWGNNITIQVANYATQPKIVKVPGAFSITVYKSGVLVEGPFICSTNPQALDGYGNNIFAETVLEGSAYIRAKVNTTLTAGTQPNQLVTAQALTGGSDGAAVGDTQLIAALSALNNSNDAKFSILIDGGWATPAFATAIDALCIARGDCRGILSTRYTDEISATYVTALLTYRDSTLNINDYNVALYSPHLKIQDRYNNRQIFVAPDGYMASVISQTAALFDIWVAPAGTSPQDMLPVIDVATRFTPGDMNSLYDDGINPIRFKRGSGISPWGQKTLLSQPSALDRQNVSLLLVAVIPPIVAALETFLFKANNTNTQTQVSAMITRFMKNVKARFGVYDFGVICNASNNTPQVVATKTLIASLYMSPTIDDEYINFNVVLLNPGVQISVG
jgi:phage tail sheath protein FI